MAAGLALCFSQLANSGTILLTKFDVDGGAFAQMQSNLESMGHTVDIVDATIGGNVANALLDGNYNQVFLWDLTATQFLNQDDISALGSFWNDNRGLVVDTRSYGHYFQGNQSSEVALLGNIATNLDLSGGGVWVGSDHAPSWTRNANLFLDEIGIQTITGSFSDPVNFADPTSVLLSGVIPTDLWGGGESVGRAPIGIQSNGTEMFLHFGSVDGQNVLPYISASFDLRGVNPVNTPSLFGLLALSLAMLVRRKLSK